MRIKRIFCAIFVAILLSANTFALCPAEPLQAYTQTPPQYVALDADPADYPSVYSVYEPTDAERADSNTFFIRINRQMNTVTVYIKSETGEYDTPVMAMVCSVGTATPTGNYKTSSKYDWHALFGNSYGQYCTRIVGSILFHSVPYTDPSNDALKYDEFNKLGTSASMGCIRLQAADAYWIYTNCAYGTRVEIYDSFDPGPLGKPDFTPIDTTSVYRGWDPTDPHIDNPWRAFATTAPEEDLPKILGIE